MLVMRAGKIAIGTAPGLTSALATATTTVIGAIPILILVLIPLLMPPYTAAAHAPTLLAAGEKILVLLTHT